ncbi:MAG: carbohydrate kinase [Proteobacteria bacterium]|nr:carbohydrate kinase [Pseudomonadota bacterium]
MTIQASVLCVGETLWDVLPTGEFLGGAPLNVAAHLVRLGTPAALVSRVGIDWRGHLALERMHELHLDTSHVQTDARLPTGEARAVLDATGSASYAFLEPAAWDRIEAGDGVLDAARRSRAVVFGTLAQRAPASRSAIDEILGAAEWRVLDVNLRAPHADRDVAMRSLERADFVKLNEHELVAFARWFGIEPEPGQLQEFLALEFGTTTLCITRGPEGAVLWHEGRWTRQAAFATAVVDTIGAGDAFLAMLLSELLCGRPASLAMERAAHLAAYVASRPGAVPPYDAGQFRSGE